MNAKKCTVEGCDRTYHAKGYCKAHYNRWSRYGTPNADQVVRTSKEATLCDIHTCSETHFARGWCKVHYLRWFHSGDAEKQTRAKARTPEESFALRTKWDGECLVWTGYINPNGYGIISGAASQLAHRYAWERVKGPIPDEVSIDHRCFNTACVNVDHLRLASAAENGRYLKGPHSNNSSGYRNVHRQGNKWVVTLGKDWKKHHFGTYLTVEEAALVAEKARKDLFGEFAGRG